MRCHGLAGMTVNRMRLGRDGGACRRYSCSQSTSSGSGGTTGFGLELVGALLRGFDLRRGEGRGDAFAPVHHVGALGAVGQLRGGDVVPVVGLRGIGRHAQPLHIHLRGRREGGEIALLGRRLEHGVGLGVVLGDALAEEIDVAHQPLRHRVAELRQAREHRHGLREFAVAIGQPRDVGALFERRPGARLAVDDHDQGLQRLRRLVGHGRIGDLESLVAAGRRLGGSDGFLPRGGQAEGAAKHSEQERAQHGPEARRTWLMKPSSLAPEGSCIAAKAGHMEIPWPRI